MIFKTFRQSLEDVYIAGRKINELNNLKLNATNIAVYATALKGLNAKQAELVLSTQGLAGRSPGKCHGLYNGGNGKGKQGKSLSLHYIPV